MKTVVKNLLFFGGYYSLLKVMKGGEETRLLILMYHDFAEPNSGSHVANGRPTRAQFAAHCKEASKQYRVMSVEAALEEIEREGMLRKDTVAITIDDGYASAYHIAYPVLKEYNLPATVFLITNWVNGTMRPWWLDLADMVRVADFKKVSTAELTDLLGYDFTSDNGVNQNDSPWRGRFFSIAERLLRSRENTECHHIVARLERALELDSRQYRSQHQPLSWMQIQEMSKSGIRFAGHTMSHPNLRYTSLSTAERELVESRREIENRIQVSSPGFAYPYGVDLDAYVALEPVLMKHKFSYAVTATYGSNRDSDNPYMLRRATLSNSVSRAVLGRELVLELLAKHHAQ